MSLLEEIHDKRVDLTLHQQGIDTMTPAGKVPFQIDRSPAVIAPVVPHRRSVNGFPKIERARIRFRIVHPIVVPRGHVAPSGSCL